MSNLDRNFIITIAFDRDRVNRISWQSSALHSLFGTLSAMHKSVRRTFSYLATGRFFGFGHFGVCRPTCGI